MKEKMKKFYMSVAQSVSQLSTAEKLKVGCVAVKDDKIISFGYNGTPAGWDNKCEDTEYMAVDAGGLLDPEEIIKEWPHEQWRDNIYKRYKLVTKPEVIHAEMNCLMKLAKSNESSQNSILFITHAPCMNCSKAIYQAGIKHVYYKQTYRLCDGIDFLEKTSTCIEQYNGD